MPVHVTPLTFDASKLVFGNYPNQVKDVHTTHFTVMGEMAAFVEAIKVDIYDLYGKKVYSPGHVFRGAEFYSTGVFDVVLVAFCHAPCGRYTGCWR